MAGSEASDPRAQLLYELACSFASRIELDELLPFVIGRSRETLAADAVSILLLDTERDELFFPYVAEEDPVAAERLLKLRIPAEQGIAGDVLRTLRAEHVPDVSRDPRFSAEADRHTGTKTREILAAPLLHRGAAIGVMQAILRRSDQSFTPRDGAFLEALAGSVAVAIENARLYSRVRASEEALRSRVGVLQRDLQKRDREDAMVGGAPAMQPVLRLMESAAASPISVVVTGETGTGKELVARSIHRAGERSEGPFVAVNCAALPESLLESELFGHRKGSFTGALQDRRGLFEAASGGTIFLDEVGEMPAVMQAKLLRVLQEGEIVPVGDVKPRKVDVRVISATHRDLSAEVARGTFREDLYYRLTAFPIHLPPLRERREDLPALASRFVAAAAGRHRKHVPGIDADAMATLARADWPGNVRQLQNEIERAVALAREGEPVRVAHLSPLVLAGGGGPAGPGAAGLGASPAPPSVGNGLGEDAGVAGGGATVEGRSSFPWENGPLLPMREARANFEARYLAWALREEGNNVSRTARRLGLSRFMVQKKMKEFGLRQP